MPDFARRGWLLASWLGLSCTSGEPLPVHGEPAAVEHGQPQTSPAPPLPELEPPSAGDGRREFAAGTLPGALELASSYVLEHLHQDMNFYTTRRYDMNLRLAIEADGRATLRLVGTLEIGGAELLPDNAGRSEPRRELTLDEAWSGAARLLDGDLVIRFETSTAYQPPLAIDVEWVCSPTRVAMVDGGPDMDAWQCSTLQASTQPSGPGHALVVYLQAPLTLAAPSERLHVDAYAKGGANDRSSLSSASHSRDHG